MPCRGRPSLKGWVKYNGKRFWTVNLYEIKKANRTAEVSFGNKEVETERWKRERFRGLQGKQEKYTHTQDRPATTPLTSTQEKKNK